MNSTLFFVSKRHRWIVAFVLWLLCLVVSLPSSAAEAISTPLTVKVGAYDNYPKIFLDNTGKYAGIFPDILSAVAKRQGWKLEYVSGTWPECMKRLESGKIDIMVDVAYSKKRAAKFDFNDESVFMNWGAIYTRADLDVATLTELQGLRIAVMKGSIHTSGKGGIKGLLKRFDVKPAKFIEVASYKDVFQMLDMEQADAGVVNRIYGVVFEGHYNVGKTSIIFNPINLHFAFPKKGKLTKELKSAIDKDLIELKREKNSSYYRSLEKYLTIGPPMTPIVSTKDGTERIALTEEEEAWVRAHPVVRFAVDPEFVPYEFLGANGEFGGIASDYVRLVSKRLGIKFERVTDLSWDDAVKEAREKNIDAFPCVGKTGKRMEFLRYSRPYTQYNRIVVTRTNAPFITGLSDIADLKIAVQENTSHEGYLLENTAIRPVGYKTLRDALESVSRGDTDAMVGNLAAVAYWIRTLDLTNLKVAAPAGESQSNLYFAVRKDWPELVLMINKALLSITPEEGQAIMQRWVGLEFKTGLDPIVVKKYAINIAIGGSLLLLIIFAWTYNLKKEVAKRREVEARLRYSNELKGMLTKISTDFVSLPYQRINTAMQGAMQRIGQVLQANTVYLLRVDSSGVLYCAEMWKEGTKGGSSTCEDHGLELVQTPWRKEKIMNGEMIIIPSVAALEPGEESAKTWLEGKHIGSLFETPLSYEGNIVGLLGISSSKDGVKWDDVETAFMQLTGQVFTNAFKRQNFEQALQENAKALRIANDRLQELDHLKSMFIASMSHELRTPLNSIIGFTGIMIKGMSGELNDVQKSQLGRVYQSSKHLLALITDVIDISKIESGRVDVFIEPFSLSEVIQEAVTVVEPAREKKGLALQVNMNGEILMKTDRKRVLQCLLNFLSNSIKYTEKGTVTLSVVRQDSQVEIEVKDTGIGIEEKDMPRLFEPFERMESHLKVKAGGTGLGLYLTKKLVSEMLHGEVFMHSKPGQGSTFGMRIPIDLNNFSKNNDNNAGKDL
ncbi:Signal transduction histidine kinase [Maridesulfovibrio ferrireducens]|uniref:histidine kinase n=1 Tax=Maridesulfovibrio ferrireducens TaxID=246191 RepID=A0A1G9FXS3_9BACT|nr:transporter substrate-binding domain-containing protein [Maridesulfovibrio ferrireducens]SDK93167.1 Signal transduction histidine kinase [Maridesulfovibrio ferrireducens]